MVSDTLLSMLRCPEDGTELQTAQAGVLAAVNWQIEAGQVVNRAGRTLERPIEEGLVRAAGDVLYPVVNGIPLLLIEEGIPL